LILLFVTLHSVSAAHDDPRPRKPVSLQQLESSLADSVSCTIPFSRAGNLILIRAKADTTEGNFILDTGAPGLVLNITYFRDYPATTIIDEEQSGITGVVTSVKRTSVKAFSFGCIKSPVVSADLINLGHLENAKGVRIMGLIGLSFLKQFEMIIDYENSLLYFHRIAKNEAATYKSPMLKDKSTYSVVPIEIWNHKIVTRTTIGGKKLRLIIDSGAESNLLDSRLPNKVFENVEILRRVQLMGAGQKKVEALYGNLNNLSIGGQNTGTLPVVITNLEKTCLVDNTCIDGILGFDFLSLHKIGFNFVTNKMYIWK
jgi:Aspartyl protease